MADRALDVKLLQVQKTAKIMGKAIREWGDKDLRRAMLHASKAAAQEAVPYVRRVTPVDTGLLQRNIKAGGTRTIPKLKVGTPKRGGPYAWIVHNRWYPYVRVGVSRAYPKIYATYIAEHDKVAKAFNDKVRERTRRMS